MPTREQLFFPELNGLPRAKIGQTNPFAGLTTVSSGSAAQTVSTAHVTSGALIFTGTVAVQSLGVNSGGHLLVTSIVDGTSFNIARADGQAVAWDETVSWLIYRTGD